MKSAEQVGYMDASPAMASHGNQRKTIGNGILGLLSRPRVRHLWRHVAKRINALAPMWQSCLLTVMMHVGMRQEFGGPYAFNLSLRDSILFFLRQGQNSQNTINSTTSLLQSLTSIKDVSIIKCRGKLVLRPLHRK